MTAAEQVQEHRKWIRGDRHERHILRDNDNKWNIREAKTKQNTKNRWDLNPEDFKLDMNIKYIGFEIQRRTEIG